jgi:hypothetical protein
LASSMSATRFPTLATGPYWASAFLGSDRRPDLPRRIARDPRLRRLPRQTPFCAGVGGTNDACPAARPFCAGLGVLPAIIPGEAPPNQRQCLDMNVAVSVCPRVSASDVPHLWASVCRLVSASTFWGDGFSSSSGFRGGSGSSTELRYLRSNSISFARVGSDS